MDYGKIKTLVFSPTGGTQKVAEIVANQIDRRHQVIDLCDNESEFSEVYINSEDIVVIAVPVYEGRVPDVALERIMEIPGSHATAIIVCVYGNRAYDNALALLLDAAKKADFRVVGAIAAIAEHSLFRDVASGRPDRKDQACLKQMTNQILNKMDYSNYAIPEVPGKVTPKKKKNQGMAPGITAQCTKCKLCVDQCPVYAIDPETLKADKSKCISCMRCASFCPLHARKLSKVTTSIGGAALGVICQNRKEPELFL